MAVEHNSSRATVKDFSTGRMAESDAYESKSLNAGYNFTGSLPEAGSTVRVMMHFKFDDAGEANDETTKNPNYWISSSKPSIDGVTGQALERLTDIEYVNMKDCRQVSEVAKMSLNKELS